MAESEYIGRNQIKYTNSPVGAIASKLDISNIPTANVVERSEYDNLHNLAKSWLEEKKELEKANDELRSKIDKTIEEIKHCKVYGHTDCARLVSLPEVLTILKRNIYEEEKIK